MLNIIRKLKNKSKKSFGDTSWKHDPERDKRALVLSWFYKLPKNSKILEAGCGIGNYVISLSKMRHDTVGIEIDPERVDIAKKNMKKFGISDEKILQGDLSNLPFKDGEFDAIFCHGVIEHIADSERAVKEMARVLKKDGYAMISVPNRYTSFTLSKISLQAIDKITGSKFWNVGFEKSFPQWKFKKMIERHMEIKDFVKREVQPGITFPLYGKILKILDKPLWIVGIGGGWLYSWSQKNN